ncbi:GNAT family N-acetyltransferase [Flavobacterium degerlachei]|jgi:RimJ/RimL family protein N-acetyltransferase|uniref:Protein N-acetyltransferase, RimJ/RimL family n=1 Tax=Flavobacterium degerlachei TaxID=229203 RepID=A0A1H3EYP5_9FLAO|nr:GNAT family N-acetyltransferase [Flavobacterium degerlachei]SDX83861.1 Protein N-acetyltransferase, RimJ/RimL family [Flavobacterium degerlachei]
MKIGTIETERLILRKLIPSDDEGMFLLDSNPNVHRYLGNKPVTSIEESREYINNILIQYIQNGVGRFAVILKETNEFIGWAGLKFITEPVNERLNFYDIGYRFIEDYWGKGYAQEAAKAWLDYGFNQLKIQKICAYADIENKGSRKILEKIGLQHISEFDDEGTTCAWLELTKTDYLK